MWVYGRHAVEEILRSQLQVGKLLLVEGINNDDVRDLINLAKRRGCTLKSAARKEMDRMTDANHQGVALQLLGIPVWDLKNYLSTIDLNKKPFLCLLDEIQDPQNLGAIIRSAVCFGCDAIVLPKWRSASVTDSVMRASSGACAHIPIIEIANLNVAIERLKEKGFFVYGADVSAEKSLAKIEFSFPLALVLGNEHRGIKPLLKKACDELLAIPQRSALDSLNVSNAATVFFYEISKQR